MTGRSLVESSRRNLQMGMDYKLPVDETIENVHQDVLDSLADVEVCANKVLYALQNLRGAVARMYAADACYRIHTA